LIVLDTSALISSFRREPGADMVDAAFSECAMSSVNVSEFLSKVSDWGQDIVRYVENLNTSGIEFVDFTFARSVMAARLRERTRSLGLSLGDRACIALAIERQCMVMTADRAWAKIEIDVKVVVIR
jgi:PIN domain nuclease of toxin-antitoxin system